MEIEIVLKTRIIILFELEIYFRFLEDIANKCSILT